MKKILMQLFFMGLAVCTYAVHDVGVGASRIEVYFPLIVGKRIAILTNHTAYIGDGHLVDLLINAGMTIQKIFVPEHGFRGEVGAGAQIIDGIDERTGLPLVSLYGAKKKPTSDDLKDVDVLIYDIQDVGVRFYTYIASMQYFMEAAAEHEKLLIVLDRPNPNGFYVDGPVCEKQHHSFVGRQSIPIVYGMTIGEYALMLNGEGWLAGGRVCQLVVVPCTSYSHADLYRLPIAPSPNLQTMTAVYVYPSLGLFEGTPISVGRGTFRPFEVVGHPMLPPSFYSFTPSLNTSNPPFLDQVCYGFNIADTEEQLLSRLDKKINLRWLIDVFELFSDKAHFFNFFFTKLAGTEKLAYQISSKWSEQSIRESWQPAVAEFKKIRKRYVLYTDCID